MTNPTNIYTIRDAVPEDKNFVLATFLRGLYYGDSWFSKIPKDIFMANYKNIATALYDKCIVKVACLTEDPNLILGYSILSQDYQSIHWVYVKQAYRNQGITKDLLPKHPVSVSHLSKLGSTLLTKYPDTVFNPWRL